MPCNSDYLNASYNEEVKSKVCCVLDDLEGKKIEAIYWRGYHPNAYSKEIPKIVFDEMVAFACSKLTERELEGTLNSLSLETLMWWRDHKIADEHRLKKEKYKKEVKALKEKALSKLTSEEKSALNVFED